MERRHDLRAIRSLEEPTKRLGHTTERIVRTTDRLNIKGLAIVAMIPAISGRAAIDAAKFFRRTQKPGADRARHSNAALFLDVPIGALHPKIAVEKWFATAKLLSHCAASFIGSSSSIESMSKKSAGVMSMPSF